MFVEVRSDAEAFAFWLMCGNENTDGDYRRYVDAVREAGERWREHPCPLAVQLVETGNPSPDAAWRRQIASARRGIPGHTLFVLVTESPLIRGVVTAINWLQPAGFTLTVEASLDAASSWISARRAVPDLHEFHSRARRAAVQHGLPG